MSEPEPIYWTNCTVQLGDLQPWERNPRRLTRKQAERLADSWQEFGQVETVAIGPGNEVYNGHQRLNVLLALHGAAYEIDARRASRALSEDERRKLVAYLHAGAVGSWDWDALSGWDVGELATFGFDADLLAEWNDDAANLATMLRAEEQEPPADPGPQINRAEELRQKWGVETGQLWEIPSKTASGAHRAICGDCTDRAVVERVMGGERADMIFTDPPYGHNNNDGDLIHNRERALGQPETMSSLARPIENDSPEEAARVYSAFLRISNDLLNPGCCCCCCCCGGGPDPQFARWALEMDTIIGFKHAVVWDKGGLGMGWHYRRNYEFVLIAQKKGAACHWFGGDDVPNVIRGVGKIIPSADQHPTEKPVELAEWFIRLHSTNNDAVFDPFLGSGTTIVACERLGRLGRGIEIAPGYVAVTLERLAALGLEPRRIEKTSLG